MRADQVLDAAADTLDRDGWCQGAFHEGGTHCAYGALTHTVFTAHHFGFHEGSALADAAGDLLARAVGSNAVTRWNDAPGRTKDEVTSAMRACAANLRAAHHDGTEKTLRDATRVPLACIDTAPMEKIA